MSSQAPDTTLGQLSQLINQRKFLPAIAYGRDALRRDPTLSQQALFMFRMALASRLANRPEDAEHYWGKARGCTDYSPVLDHDFRRDEILQMIRGGDVATAREHFERSSAPEGDIARQGAWLMTEARLLMHEGQHDQASTAFSSASSLLCGAEEAGSSGAKQWLLNNATHWMVCNALQGNRIAVRVHTMRLTEDPAASRRRMAKCFALISRRAPRLLPVLGHLALRNS